MFSEQMVKESGSVQMYSINSMIWNSISSSLIRKSPMAAVPSRQSSHRSLGSRSRGTKEKNVLLGASILPNSMDYKHILRAISNFFKQVLCTHEYNKIKMVKYPLPTYYGNEIITPLSLCGINVNGLSDAYTNQV